MVRRPPRSTLDRSSAASDVYKRQAKVRPEQGLLRMRKELGLYANLRPIKLFDELLSASSIKPEILKGADILFFRELTGDIYLSLIHISEPTRPY